MKDDRQKQNTSLIIHVGSSNSYIKKVQLPFADMIVSPIPQNKMKSHWKDEFHTEVIGSTLVVTRIDCKKGWSMELKLKASTKQVQSSTSKNGGTHDPLFSSHCVISGGVCYVSGERTVKSATGHNPSFQFSTKFLGTTNQSEMIVITLDPNQKICAKVENVVYIKNGLLGEIRASNAFAGDKNKSLPLHRDFEKIVGFMSGKPKMTSIQIYAYDGPAGTNGSIALGSYTGCKIILFPLVDFGHKLYCQKGSYLASALDVTVEDSDFEPDHLDQITGSGDVFLQANSNVVKKNLISDESMIIRSTSIVAFTRYIDFEVVQTRALLSEEHEVYEAIAHGLSTLSKGLFSHHDENEKKSAFHHDLEERVDKLEQSTDPTRRKRMCVPVKLTGPGQVWISTLL
mmetsp:Transcript_4481/g.8603  ORF Transcript_4481/g.8603 Transcript_4481/m.8603 type:complete len:400 (+) Transcript_4481:1963-3162(+)